jgi:hypothetical protein
VLTSQQRSQREDALVEGAGPALHQPVGVQGQDRAWRELDAGLAVDGRTEAERLAGGKFGYPGGAVGQGQDGRQVTGPGQGAGVTARVDHRVGAGRQRDALQRGGHAVQPAEQLGGGQVQVGQGVGGGAELGHHRRGLRPVAHDVTHHEPGPVPRQRDDVVPVAADDVARGRQAAPGDIQAGRHRGGGGEQAAVQRVGDRPVPHQGQRVDDARPRLRRQPAGGRGVAVAEGGLVRPADQEQHSCDHVPGGQRDREERGVAGQHLASDRMDVLQARPVGLVEPHRAAAVHAAGARRGRGEGDHLARREGRGRQPPLTGAELYPEPARHYLGPLTAGRPAGRLAALEQVL